MGKRYTKKLMLNGQVVGEYLGSDDLLEDRDAAIAALKEKELYREPTLLGAMRAQARAFMRASHLAFSEAESMRASGKPPVTYIPFIVNASFAVELFLKTLIQAHTGQVPRSVHDLSKLHGALPDDVQRQLQDLCEQYKSEFAPDTSGRFDERLVPIAKAFVEWRYAYETGETGMVNPYSLILVLRACHEACKLVDKLATQVPK